MFLSGCSNPGEVAVDVVTGRKMAGHDGSTAWRTNPAGYREAMKVSTLLGQPVDIGRLEVRMAVTAQVPQPQSSAKMNTMLGPLP